MTLIERSLEVLVGFGLSPPKPPRWPPLCQTAALQDPKWGAIFRTPWSQDITSLLGCCWRKGPLSCSRLQSVPNSWVRGLPAEFPNERCPIPKWVAPQTAAIPRAEHSFAQRALDREEHGACWMRDRHVLHPKEVSTTSARDLEHLLRSGRGRVPLHPCHWLWPLGNDETHAVHRFRKA